MTKEQRQLFAKIYASDKFTLEQAYKGFSQVKLGKNMQPYQERVIQERDELNERLTKLRAFLDKDNRTDVNGAMDNNLMCIQEYHMSLYLETLDQRIALFKDKEQ